MDVAENDKDWEAATVGATVDIRAAIAAYGEEQHCSVCVLELVRSTPQVYVARLYAAKGVPSLWYQVARL